MRGNASGGKRPCPCGSRRSLARRPGKSPLDIAPAKDASFQVVSTNKKLAFERETDGSGTHALIIAPGGFPERPSLDLRLPLLTARSIADWLITNYRNPGAPLASID